MNSTRSSHEIKGLPRVLIDGFKHKMDDVDIKDRCYFLTHFHGDHYGGLTASWRWGTIYCSDTTANLICNIMKVKEEWVRRVAMDSTISIQGAKVTFLSANHCPGAVLLLFQLSSGLTHLHTGDMRYSPAMKLYPALQSAKVDRLYLDTTYAHPKHTFLPQDESISTIVSAAVAFMRANPQDGIIYLSAYNLGKERVIFAVADAVQSRVYMDHKKIKIMQQIDGGRQRVASGKFTTNPHAARVHVCGMGELGSLHPYFKPNFKNISALWVRKGPYNKALAFIPTGWAASSNWNLQHSVLSETLSGVEVTVQTVPYSEHSNYDELIEFVTFVKPREVVPTVYNDVSLCSVS
ncbi:beta-lactamase-like protein [Ochromonadaceae sp. CCMP2298]|nr:beta-lactamase-like protein [Ochromonadaceae sp. CCMP2298]